MNRWIERLCVAVVIAVAGTFILGVLLLGTGLGHRILTNDEPRPVVRPVMRPMPNLGWALWSYKGGGKWEAMGIYDNQEACEARLQAADPDRRIQDLEKKWGRQLRFCELSTLPHWDSRIYIGGPRKNPLTDNFIGPRKNPPADEVAP